MRIGTRLGLAKAGNHQRSKKTGFFLLISFVSLFSLSHKNERTRTHAHTATTIAIEQHTMVNFLLSHLKRQAHTRLEKRACSMLVCVSMVFFGMHILHSLLCSRPLHRNRNNQTPQHSHSLTKRCFSFRPKSCALLYHVFFLISSLLSCLLLAPSPAHPSDLSFKFGFGSTRCPPLSLRRHRLLKQRATLFYCVSPPSMDL
jgi:hypothetical protein